MACVPYNHGEGKVLLVPAKANISFVKGDMLVDDGAGYITTVSGGGGVDVHFVAAETVTSGSTDGATLLTVWSTRGTRFLCDTDANPAQTDVGTIADIAAAGTIDPDASTDDIFYIEKILGAVADKKVLGYFNHANET